MSAIRSTQLFFAASQYAAATVTAAIRAGQFGPRAEHRRLLVVSDTSPAPEVGTPLDRMAGFDSLRPEFDEVLSWNAFISPFHPAGWFPREQDTLLWERYLRLAWGLGDGPVEIACESIQANPSSAVAKIFGESPIHLYADGLMSYGPTRSKIDPLIGTRVRRLLHLDLVPGLRPLLMTEFDVEPEVVPTAEFLKVLGELAASAEEFAVPADAPALLLGQYLSAIDVLTTDEEQELHLRMLRGTVALGHTRVVFKPHPAAPVGWSRALEQEAARLGADLTVLDAPVIAEVVYERTRPALVVGAFSTALLTAAAFYGIPVARVGTEELLAALTPYQNSNRVPVTIVDALLPALEDRAAVTSWRLPDEDRVRAELSGLVTAVGFAMQPQIYPRLRPAAEAYLAAHPAAASSPYFRRRRLTALALPGALPAQFDFIPRNATVRRIARQAAAWKRGAEQRLPRGRAARG
ncbi:polysialyltransferase family glycosyltransferase [Streptomyces sp. NRRL B-1381]|uniref:polysialyltransferase family glycosyltransferase n=1 Tax=Streptomyces sp. NRRL B-1381 TaxID=1463829 RepID=UPI0004BF701B|nr:polysialyltransferase family glycosyltransferase [Streptomyces sp. NRRL B-1381]